MRHLPIVAILLAGCAAVEPQKSRYAAADSRPDLASYVERADEVAEEVLSEHNREVKVRLEREPQFRGLIGEYFLPEYERRVSERTDPDGNPIVDVSYKLTTPHGFLGHPAHFNVWVYKTSGKTRVFGGQ